MVETSIFGTITFLAFLYGNIGKNSLVKKAYFAKMPTVLHAYVREKFVAHGSNSHRNTKFEISQSDLK